MSNDYFYTYSAPSRFGLARAEQLIAITDAVIAGFDKLPSLVHLRENRATFVTEGGGSAANAYIVTTPNSVTAYTQGLHLRFLVTNTSSGASTINVNGLGAKSIKRYDGSALSSGDVKGICDLTYDGTDFRLLSSGADATAAAASAAAASSSASSASTSASNASTSASNAATSASSAATSASAAAAAVRRLWTVPVTDPQGDTLTTGDGKLYLPIPLELNGLNLVDVEGYLSPAAKSSSGIVTVMLARSRGGSVVDMLSTAITIDQNEESSLTAATAPVINTSNDDMATGDYIRIDIDGAGTNAKGLSVTLAFQ